MFYLFITIFFFVAELLYFRIADRFQIIDKPNERSSHTRITIRGGGIIFLMAAVVMLAMNASEYLYPMLGVLIIGTISFLDDLYTLSNKIRILFHLLAVSLVFQYLGVFNTFHVLAIGFFYVLVIGIINAYNFMDGINGITGAYSLVILGALQYVNLVFVPFTDPMMIWLPLLAAVVFLFFNFRLKAKCFAGDVGSVSMALWIITLILDLVFTTGNWSYILFLSVYGVDTVLTISHRLILRQNIFKAHRLHFYQILANERQVPHLVVSSFYALLQASICLFIIHGAANNVISTFVIVLLPLTLIYVFLKPGLMKNPVNALS
jgi:UDP-N-acetylmuramyl pentapeptide phosphotransferase/UDP-N-acetylglucosamine-1-phosphate transferase